MTPSCHHLAITCTVAHTQNSCGSASDVSSRAFRTLGSCANHANVAVDILYDVIASDQATVILQSVRSFPNDDLLARRVAFLEEVRLGALAWHPNCSINSQMTATIFGLVAFVNQDTRLQLASFA